MAMGHFDIEQHILIGGRREERGGGEHHGDSDSTHRQQWHRSKERSWQQNGSDGKTASVTVTATRLSLPSTGLDMTRPSRDRVCLADHPAKTYNVRNEVGDVGLKVYKALLL